MHLPSFFPFLFLLPTLTTATLVIETSTSTYTASPTTTSSPSSSSTSPSSSSSDQYTSPTLFESTILNTTNAYRTHHNATPLSWNASLASYASTYASRCNFSHSHSTGTSSSSFGENLAENYDNVTAAVRSWGDEGRGYRYGKDGGGESSSTGHFTQLVWKATTDVGCGRSECDGDGGGDGGGGAKGWLVVCEYWPRGNVEGEFDEQVGREVGRWVSVGDDGGRVGGEMAAVVEQVVGGGARGREGGNKGGLWAVVGAVGVGVVVGLGV